MVVRLDDWRDYITGAYQSDTPVKEIFEHLSNNGVKCCRATFFRRLQEWGLPRRQPRGNADPQALAGRIMDLHYVRHLTDQRLLEVLRDEGWESLSLNLIRRVRADFGIHKWRKQRTEEEEAELRQVIKEAISSGECAGLGRNELWRVLRLRGQNVAAHSLFRLVKEIDPEGVHKRKHNGRRGRPKRSSGPRPESDNINPSLDASSQQ